MLMGCGLVIVGPLQPQHNIREGKEGRRHTAPIGVAVPRAVQLNKHTSRGEKIGGVGVCIGVPAKRGQFQPRDTVTSKTRP